MEEAPNMKKIVVVLCLVFLIVPIAEAQHTHRKINQRLRYLEDSVRVLLDEVEQLRRWNDMVSGTMPSDLSIYIDGNDPTEPGDIKVVKGSLLELDDCDSNAAWSIVAGAGVTITESQGPSGPHEGTGCLHPVLHRRMACDRQTHRAHP